MDKLLFDTSFLDHPLPIIIQEFFWKQTCLFVRPKFGKHHEASCTHCQNTHIHNDMKEACKILEKVLVQNIPLDSRNPCYKAINSVNRWVLIQSAFPHILHCAASLLQYRKDVMDVNLNESKLLYILHWLILDAAEECMETDMEKGIYQCSPFYYIFPITSVTLFVYLIAPLVYRIKESDLQSYRLENGLKIWRSLWEYRHPEAACFTTYCKINPKHAYVKNIHWGEIPTKKGSFKGQLSKDDCYHLKSKLESPQSPNVSYDEPGSSSAPSSNGQSTPATTTSTAATTIKTVVTEYSHKTGEHMVIFHLPSVAESGDTMQDAPTVFSGKVPILQLAMGRAATSVPRTSLPCEQLQVPADIKNMTARHSITNTGVSIERDVVDSVGKVSAKVSLMDAISSTNLYAATFMDVAVLRCLFISQWSEEGIHWALNFLYRRLLVMNEILVHEEQPRKRSNSLPSPKVGMAFYGDRVEFKRKYYYKDSIDAQVYKGFPMVKVTGASGGGNLLLDHHKHGEKAKKKMKMADFKTFVEAKLLSRSEKNLETLTDIDNKDYFETEHHRSLDMEDAKHLTHPTTSIARLSEFNELDDGTCYRGLVKGNSMPSLSCLLDEIENEQRIGEHTSGYLDAHGLCNPIITVTQHTPNPSPEYLRRKNSINNHFDIVKTEYEKSAKSTAAPLSRSQSDFNISYMGDMINEAPGSTNFMTEDGDLDITVVLKALYNITTKDKTFCTIAVCEMVLRVLELLIEMGILKKSIPVVPMYKNEGSLLYSLELAALHKDQSRLTPLVLCVTCIFRIIKHLGCPNHCGEIQKPVTGISPDFLRSRCHNILRILRKHNVIEFNRFVRGFVDEYSVSKLMEFFHSFLGFCMDPSSLLSPNQKRNVRSPDSFATGSYATNFGANVNGPGNSHGIESQILSCVFKKLISEFVKLSKDVKIHDNMSLYHEIRLLINYVKEVHGGIFRDVLLSGLIDTAIKPHSKPSNVQTTKVFRHISQEEREKQNQNDSYFVVDDRETKRSLFKKRSTSSAGASLHDTDDSEDKLSQSPHSIGKSRIHSVLTPRQSERNLRTAHISVTGSRSHSKFPISGIVNWFRKEYGRSESTESRHSDSPVESALARQISTMYCPQNRQQPKNLSKVGKHLTKAKKRVGDQLNKFGLKKGKKKHHSMEESVGSYFSRRNSADTGKGSRDSEYAILKERRLVSTDLLLSGMRRFSYLMEACYPGSVPDPQLVTAMLDMPYTPVVARAAFLLECAYFVQCCNRGQWPLWMKFNLPGFRPSGNLMHIRASTAPNGARRAQLMQKTAGKLFYLWGVGISARLEEMTESDKEHVMSACRMVCDESKHVELRTDDEEEDFLDEATTSLFTSECPFSLRMIACVLLMEITAYLRDTYENLPKSMKKSNRGDRSTVWEKNYYKDRRFSAALSSMGHSQASAQSLQSIPGDRETSERKISFVLNEPDGESEESTNTTNTAHTDDMQYQGHGDDKKTRKLAAGTQNRPYLLRRSTAGQASAQSSSVKRQSYKLKKGTNKEIIKDSTDNDFKRVDSIQSKRQKGSLSDRSDTSEPGAGSGEESPNIVESPDEQPPESPTDSNETDDSCAHLPWIKVVIQMMNSLNYLCSHRRFCHPFCYRRQMRACSRLTRAVRKVYGDQFDSTESDTLFSKPVVKDPKGQRSGDRSVSFPSPIKRKESIEKKLGFIDDGKDMGLLQEQSNDKFLECIGVKKPAAPKGSDEPLPIVKYIKTQVRDGFQSPLAIIVKAIVTLNEEHVKSVLPVAWDLLLESNQELSATAASAFIVSAFRAPNKATEIMQFYLNNDDPNARINAILKFQVLWKHRYQPWPRMEDKAQSTFKLPPPAIEFTLTSPKIGIESLPVVDPPWLPVVNSMQVDKLADDKHRSFTAHSRKKDKRNLEYAYNTEKQKSQDEDRKAFLISAIPITIQAANESGVHHTIDVTDHDEQDEDANDAQQKASSSNVHSQSLTALFPSSLCSAVVDIIALLDDSSLSGKGVAVYEIAYNVIWNCLVEDSSLFLRYILERLTRGNQERMFMLLRYLIRFIPKLPQQAAFALYNYIIGYVMFYVRSYHEDGQRMIGSALSILWMVVHSVHGIMFKDLKQILRKEQCDASILLTANVPSTKKIIVHGPQEADGAGIPSQFPVQEDTQFYQIWKESIDFFSIDESKQKEYFLIDHRTHQIRNLNWYVRDYYFFKRSQYPQLQLVHMNPNDALDALQKQDFHHKFIEIGKVILTWAILKNVDMVVQRVVFLHEELMKLPSFPRKALEADLDLYKSGDMGKILLGLDMLHKFMWVRLIARMFEAMAGNFAYSGDIHLFMNVLNGALILHGEDGCILRYVMATYINAAHNFKNIFSTNGYFLIIPTLMQHYSSHQINKLVTRTIEYTVKQFYLMNRKPFLLQMFGSVSSMLDMEETNEYGSVYKVEPQHLFRLLLSLESLSTDPLHIDELVKEDKPLKAIDFCYHDECETVTVLDCIELCVMVVSYAADSVRAYQMLLILEAIIPCYLKEIQLTSYQRNGKSEREIIAQLAVSVKTLVNGCEALTKNYNGRQRFSPEHKSSSQRNYNKGPYSPAYDFDEEAQSKYTVDKNRIKSSCERDTEDNEMKAEFRRSRDVLLSTVVDFVSKCSMRLIELNKKFPLDGNNVELLETRSYIRMGDIVHTLLKLSPYDPETMSCKGLQSYMSQLLPGTDWNSEALRPTLLTLIRRLDKIFVSIRMKSCIRRCTDWNAASGLIKGIYETLSRYPYISHMPSMKALIHTCLSLIVGDMTHIGVGEVMSAATTALMSQIPPEQFCIAVIRLIALQVLASGELYSLDHITGMSYCTQIPEKTENMLVHFLLPLCFEVGSGRQDIGCIRRRDISFILTMILHTMCPQMSKYFPTGIVNFRHLTEMRSIAMSATSKQPKCPLISSSLFRIAFIGLKIVTVCFEPELDLDWGRAARAVMEAGRISEARVHLWRFLDFLVTNRNPLFVLLLPFIRQKVIQPPVGEYEKQMQQIVRDKLNSVNLALPKCRSDLLTDLYEELKEIKLELESYKRVEQTKKQKDKSRNSTADTTMQRISLSDLLSGHLSASGAQIHRGSVTSTQGSGSIVEMPTTSVTKVNESSSPPEDVSTEFIERPFKPRLHRSKAQSRKTFKFRKSKMEKLQTKSEPCSLSSSQVQSPTTTTLDQQMIINITSPSTSTAAASHQNAATPSVTPQLTFETSWEEESLLSQNTSSTSGYRENCSLLMMQMESPLEFKRHVYPTEFNQGFPSTSSSTIVPTGSPESFSSGDDDDENGNLCSSRHSVLMIRTTKDNITML